MLVVVMAMGGGEGIQLEGFDHLWDRPPADLPRTDISSQVGFVEDIMGERVPRVVTGVVDSGELETLIPYLCKEIPRLKAHKSAHPYVRMHTKAAPMGGLGGVEWMRPWTEVDTDCNTILRPEDACPSGSGGAWPPCHEMERGCLYAMVGGDRLPAGTSLDLQSSFEFRRPVLIEENAWMGVGGMTTPLHYDLPHNFFAHLSGRKRVVLVSPKLMALHSHLYPRVHPSSRMSQVNWTLSPGEIKERWPGFESLQDIPADQVYDVTLEAGEVLYIPPYWGHMIQVVGHLPSLSLSTHFESQEMGVREAMNRMPLPFGNHHSRIERSARMGLFVDLLLANHGLGAANFTRFLQQRYRTLHHDPASPGLAQAIGLSGGEGPNEYMAELARLEEEIEGAIPPAEREWIEGHVGSVERVLGGYSRVEYGNAPVYGLSTTALELFNLIEDVAVAAVGATDSYRLLGAIEDWLGKKGA